MIVDREEKVDRVKISLPEAQKAFMKVLISEKEGWSDYVMRLLEIEEYGYTPKHAHPWPHINYITEGSGSLVLDGEKIPLEEGSFAYIPSGKEHQFKNMGTKIFKFLCIVPKEGHAL
jgi:quercetin dioxygenase-like cupin family protein